jgi:hypothetical protein
MTSLQKTTYTDGYYANDVATSFTYNCFTHTFQ